MRPRLQRRLVVALVWAARRHRPLEALLCAACLSIGAEVRYGAGAGLIVLGVLFFIDMAASGAAKTFGRRR